MNQWLEQWRKPIWEAIYRAEEQEAHQVMQAADEAWEAYAPGEDEHQAARLYLNFLAFQIEETFAANSEEVARLIDASLIDLAAPVESPIVAAMQARILLMQRCWAHHCHVLPLAGPEVENLLSRFSPEELDHQGWSYLAFWAFAAGSAGHLKRAYKYFLIQPIDFMVDFSRQRVKVMLALVENRCAPDDLGKLIGLMPHPRHAQWLAEYIRPAAQAQGVWSEQLQVRLAGRRAALALGKPQVPPRSKPSGVHLNF